MNILNWLSWFRPNSVQTKFMFLKPFRDLVCIIVGLV